MNDKNLEEYLLKLYNIYIKKDEYQRTMSILKILQIANIYFNNNTVKFKLKRNWEQILKNIIKNGKQEAIQYYSDLLPAISRKAVT